MVQLAHTAPLYAVLISTPSPAAVIATDIDADDTCPTDDDGMS